MADVKYKEILSVQTAREEEEKEEEEEEDSPSDQSVAGRRRIGAGDTTTTTLLEEEEKEEGGPMLGNWRYKKRSSPVPKTVFFDLRELSILFPNSYRKKIRRGKTMTKQKESKAKHFEAFF